VVTAAIGAGGDVAAGAAEMLAPVGEVRKGGGGGGAEG